MGCDIGEAAVIVDRLIERPNLCISDLPRDVVSHSGDDSFKQLLQLYYNTPENNTCERLIGLKNVLRKASTYDFWTILMKEMCEITNAQCGMVAKRILLDDENIAVEMPPLGEEGSCLLGVAFYLTNGQGFEKMYHDYKYQAYGSPCAHMKHDKVFVIPEKMHEFVRNSPNALPWEKSEAFIGVPLFSEGKCFAHFALIWSTDGALKRTLSWSFIEMFMHSLEDMILERLLNSRGFAKDSSEKERPPRVIPIDAITVSQSLKPYARNLSHELRTPIQGVVGLLDIMQTTVAEAMASHTNRHVISVFEELKANLDLVQDSSKRAVEAADNVVHAYDLGMQMPDAPLDSEEIGEANYNETISNSQESPQLDRAITPLEPPFSPSSRKRARIEGKDLTTGRPSKRSPMFAEAAMAQAVDSNYSRSVNPSSSRRVSKESSACNEYSPPSRSPSLRSPSLRSPSLRSNNTAPSTPRLALSDTLSSEQSYVNIRPFLVSLLSESVRDSHPINMVTAPIKGGEMIRITMERPRAQICLLLVTIIVDDDVPERIVSNEQHLRFAIRKVVDNAIKFSSNTQSSRLDISAKLSRNGLLLEIRVKDTGCGINEQSKEQLFTPHFQQDASTTRSHDGLGLSLFNAKALVRKHLGGDMTLVASSVEESESGSEFLIRFPILASHEGGKFLSSLLGTPASGATPAASRHGSTSPPPAENASSTITAPIMDLSQAMTKMRSAKLSSLDGKAFDYKTLAKMIPLKFLIAEDNPLNRDVLAKLLQKQGYAEQNILLACDGLEAVERYETSLLDPSGHIDVILMDLWMPNMDGYQATKIIFDMARKSGHAPIVIAVTADITRQSRDKAQEAGMADFISKPYTMAVLQRLIVQHFGQGGSKIDE